MRPFNVILLCMLAFNYGCTYYQVAPSTYTTAPTSKFDRAWGAALNAFSDQGVVVMREDRGAGLVRGQRNGIDLTAILTTQTDGSVRVQFDTSGAVSQDPELIQRISRSYERRMGR